MISLLKIIAEDLLPGGKGDNLSPRNVDSTQLAMGTKHEMEHTRDPEIAREIALDHLSEDPQYYSHLSSAGIDENEITIKPKVKPLVKPTTKPEPKPIRRPLNPGKTVPKTEPKAEGQMIDKITQRFKSLK